MTRMRALVGEAIAGEATERFRRADDPRTSLLTQRLRSANGGKPPIEEKVEDTPTDTPQRQVVRG